MSPTVKAKRPHPAAAPVKPKNPLVAVGLSFALPGAGQFYNGEHAKGAAFLAVALGILVYVVYAITGAMLTGDPELAIERVTEQAAALGLLSGVGFPALMAVAMADAWFGAKRANSR